MTKPFAPYSVTSTLMAVVLSGVCQAGTILGVGGKCLDVTGGNANAGTRVELWDCNGRPNQNWVFTVKGEIRGVGGKCLDVTGGGSADNTVVEIWPCTGGANQKWKFTNGLILGIDGKCLDAQGGGSANGTPIIIFYLSWRSESTVEMEAAAAMRIDF